MRVNAISFEDMTEEEKTILSQQKRNKRVKKADTRIEVQTKMFECYVNR